MRDRSRPLLVALLVALGAGPAASLSVIDPGQLPVSIADPFGLAPSELSGVAYDAASDRFVAVSDGDDQLYRLHVSLDGTTGAITSAQVESRATLRGVGGATLPAGIDLEGVAYSPARGSVFVSDETGPRIREHRLSDGATVSQIGPASAPALGVFSSIRSNLGWESLALQAGDLSMWTANEEALSVDGPPAQTAGLAGTRVRLQRFDASFAAAGQWAYLVDGDAAPGWIALVSSGVSDLVALPDGRLLVLERAAGITNPLGLDFRNRLYLVDLAGATDVSGLASIAAGGFTAVSKTLLWERVFAQDNFEGIALGPGLAGGGTSLLLVSDDGSGQHQGVLSLVLLGVPEPASAALLAAGVLALAARRRGPRKEIAR